MSIESHGHAAIMFAEVVGYPRALAHDEQRASVLTGDLQNLIAPLVTQWQGMLYADNHHTVVAIFGSPLDAMQCARAVQRRVRGRTAFELRIGVHVGDVVIGRGTVHGDGPDVAEHIAQLAPPGGIAIADSTAAQLPGNHGLALRSIGQQILKGGGTPIEIFVCAPGESLTFSIAALWRGMRRSHVLQWTAAYIAIAFGILQGIALLVDLFGAPPVVSRIAAILLAWGVPAVAIVAWFHGTRGTQPPVPRELAMLVGCVALAGITIVWQLTREPPIPLQPEVEHDAASTHAEFASPDSSSVLVLPFESPGGTAEDAYLSEAFGDELRDQLSRVPGLSVIARRSSIALRDARTDARSMATEWGVATVVEGSLRREGERFRITVRLVDAVSGVQRWSETYVREGSDLLVVQQEIALVAARAILPQISAADMPKQQWHASVNELMLLARNYQQNAVAARDQDRVIAIYEEVLEEDPDLAIAHARLGRALMLQGTDPVAAEQHLRHALSLDPQLAEGYANLGLLLWSQFREGSGALFQHAIELNANDENVLHPYSEYAQLQRSENARQYLLRARELDPMSLLINADIAHELALLGQISDVKAEMSLIERRFPDANGRWALARIADTAGLVDESIAWTLETLRLEPRWNGATEHLAESYARLGLTNQSSRVQPEPSLRTLFWERRYEEIIARMVRVDLDEADADALGFLAFALQAVGRDSEAVPILQGLGLPEIAIKDDLRRWAALHHLTTLIGSLQATGGEEEARRLAQWLDEFASAGRTERDGGWGSWYWNACARAVLGDHEQAIAAFERSAHADNLAWRPRLRDAACFRSLQDDPRYRAALIMLDTRHEALARRLPETLARHGLTKSSD